MGSAVDYLETAAQFNSVINSAINLFIYGARHPFAFSVHTFRIVLSAFTVSNSLLIYVCILSLNLRRCIRKENATVGDVMTAPKILSFQQ